jgi:aryl-alcohol dehydrogenase-like predicted oxidoreductase
MGDQINADTSDPDRRQFLKGASAATSAIVLAESVTQGGESGSLPLTNNGPDRIPHKPFGRTQETVSIIGLGGYSLGTVGSQREATRILHEAVDAGVTFMDNAWEYNDHRSEEWMGEALRGRRNRVFLMTKVCTHGRDKRVALRQLDESLKRLQTDRLDLWQIHEVIYENDPALHAVRDGVLEALDEAKKKGKVRYVGFTGHKHPSIHMRMLAHKYPYDAVQMPLNCFDATYRSFEREVLPEVNRRGIAGLGMKSMGGDGQPILHGIVTPEEALRYAMSLPVATTISGIDSMEVLRQNLAVARNFRPLSAKDMQALRDRCTPAAADGHLEMYKSTMKYDAAIGRQQHGFPSPEDLPM